MRNICAIYSILALGYVLFRYISEIKGKSYKFVEYLLGNYEPKPREKRIKPSKAEIKKNKELENGTLEPKPSSIGGVVGEEVEQDLNETSESEEIVDERDDHEEAKLSNENDETTPTNRTGYWY